MNAPTHIRRTPRRRRKIKGLGLPLAVLVALVAALLVLPVLLVQEPVGAQVSSPPTINITSPAEGSTVGGKVQVVAEVSDPDGAADVAFVRFDYRGIDVVTLPMDPDSVYSFEWDTGIDWASNYWSGTFTAYVEDVAGNSATDSIELTVDNGMYVTMTSPQEYPGERHMFYTNGTVDLAAEVKDANGDVEYVAWTIWDEATETDVIVAKDETPPYTGQWNTSTLPSGSNYVLEVTGEDSTGNRAEGYGTTWLSVTIDRGAPIVTIQAIDEAVQPGDYEAVFSVDDQEWNLTDYVEYNIDNGANGPWTKLSVDTPWEESLVLPNPSVGTHTLFMRATDKAGNVTDPVASKEFTVHKPYEWGSYEEYQGHSYASVKEPGGAGLPWSEAEPAAISEGEVYGETAHLVTIDSKAEQNWLATTSPFAAEGEMWIGLRKGEGAWGWFSGAPLTYTNWVRGEPEAGDTFATMSRAGAATGKWTGLGAQPSDSSLALPALVEFYTAPYATDFGPTYNATLTSRPWITWNEPVSVLKENVTLERRTATGGYAPVAFQLRYEGSTNTSRVIPAKRLRPASVYKVSFTAEDAVDEGISGHEEWEFGTRG